jgi:aspartyl-tRNA(Asn)/glutamyl-tRNA(Gln) amidotransferase subunit B
VDCEAVIGLEVHAQLKTDSKMFCSCSTQFGTEPNTNICPICTGQPGVLPAANHKAIELVVITGLALGCRINAFSRFSRKQYFYPDLPKNYQISQFESPLCIGGLVPITRENGRQHSIALTRIHLEEDAGKLLHQIGSREIDGSFIDFNRTGIPLMEIVSEPVIHSPDDAYAYLISLKEILEYLGVSECSMEEGKLRCDANVSIRPDGSSELGIKTELKNMNSFKQVKLGIAYEIERQKDIASAGGRILRETRLWNAETNVSEAMRSKEESHDYRYFPEPDLVPIETSESYLSELKKKIPELPFSRRERFGREYGLSAYDAGVLTAEKKLADYFEAVVNQVCPHTSQNPQDIAKLTANWITTELLGRLNAENTVIESSPIPPEHMATLVALITDKTISGKIGKQVFDAMFTCQVDPKTFIAEHNLSQVTDERLLELIIEDVIAANPKAATEYKNGKEQALGALIGQVMKKTNGKANPPLVHKILKRKLNNRS